ncbi:MAG: hypothetical protein Roseis2KO_27370 [Roseivirga sp.]
MYLKAAVLISFLTGSAILFSFFPNSPGELIIHQPENQGAVVIELFTSQGCSSCPAADRLLSEFIDQSANRELPVYGLSFHVDYWNHLGWKDPFSAREFTERQYRYADKFGNRGVYTPQMVVNGKKEFVGSSKREASSAIRTALAASPTVALKATEIAKSKNMIKLSYELNGTADGTIINIALVERGISTDVTRGENRGRKLSHDNVVRGFKQKAASENGKASLNLPKDLDLKKSSLILYAQDSDSYEILGATRVALNSLEK